MFVWSGTPTPKWPEPCGAASWPARTEYLQCRRARSPQWLRPMCLIGLMVTMNQYLMPNCSCCSSLPSHLVSAPIALIAVVPQCFSCSSFRAAGEEASGWQTLAIAWVLRRESLPVVVRRLSGSRGVDCSHNVGVDQRARAGIRANRGTRGGRPRFRGGGRKRRNSPGRQSNCRQKAANHKILACWKIQLTASYFFLRAAFKHGQHMI